jgi:hypothetical protein
LEVEGTFASIGGSTLSSVDVKPALENGVASLFGQSRLRVANQLVEDNQGLSHVNAFNKALLTKSKAYLDTVGRVHGWALDTSGEPDEAAANTPYAPAHNSGFLKRRLDAGGVIGSAYPSTAGVKKVYTLPLCDLFSFADVDKLLKGVSVRVELSLRTALERVFQVGTADTFNVQRVDLLMCIIQPSLAALPALEARYSSSEPIDFTYLNWKTYESPVSASAPSTMNYSFNITSALPRHAFTMIQQVAGQTSNIHNTCQYDTANVSSLVLKINGRLVPYEKYTPNFATGDWVRVYEELSRFHDKYDDADSGLAMTPEEWFDVVPIYYLDLSTVEPASSYQMSVETAHSPVPASKTVASVDNARSANCKIFLTTVSMATVKVNPNRGMATVELM